MSEGLAFGLFGKLPWAGDFVQHGLPSRFVGPWDDWLMLVLAASRTALGPGWDDAYLLSPPWRFRLAPGLIGATGWAGVFASSVDRVRRHYPLTLAFEIAAEDGTRQAAGAPLLDLLEEAALDLIARERPLPEALAELRARFEAVRTAGLQRGAAAAGPPAGGGRPGNMAPESADAQPGYGVSRWWHGPWNRWPALTLDSPGLPEPEACAGFFSGEWQRHGLTPGKRLGTTTSLDAELWEVSAATRTGPHHAVNQDSYAALPESGLFAVADGMGGHAHGELASQSITRMLATVAEPQAPLSVRVALVEEGISAINDALRLRSAQLVEGDIIGSTVAAALVGEGLLVCLWAGDSRVYRGRDGTLALLTEDHVLEAGGRPSHVLTRAVGSAAHLPIARRVTPTQPGDTLLLCSDGLNKALSDEELAALLGEPLPGLAERLVARAVASGGRDDVTALIARRM